MCIFSPYSQYTTETECVQSVYNHMEWLLLLLRSDAIAIAMCCCGCEIKLVDYSWSKGYHCNYCLFDGIVWCSYTPCDSFTSIVLHHLYYVAICMRNYIYLNMYICTYPCKSYS